MVEPRVTILMPVYNARRFLREAIDSILIQSFKPFELLIIDDGSTDDSAAIVSSYADPRIRLVRNGRNLGITATLNKGISMASCELIARMDADDISHPQRIQKQFGYMKRNPKCALLSTWARVISEDKEFITEQRYRENFYYYNLTFECWIYHPTIMFRKSAVEEVGKYRMTYSEGHDLFWRMSTRFPIANLSEPLVDYRITSSRVNTVLRRSEYERAGEQNVLRNIRYYMGEDFQMSHTSLECLRHNFRPMVTHYNLSTVLETLATLDAVTERIKQRENANRDIRAIERARSFKRKFILTELGNALPLRQATEMLIRARAWVVLFNLLRSFLKWHLRQTRVFRGYSSLSRLKIFSSQAVKNS
ncbi:MAG TPA: glycosyltransferase [Chryseosolibacter sp.]|nr:glycosyltransferase [Chryseosolibacter sp.]